MSAKSLFRTLTLAVCGVCSVATGAAQDGTATESSSLSPEQQAVMEKLRALHWVRGTTKVDIAGNSVLIIPEGYVFLDKADTSKFLELNQNLSSGTEVMVAPDTLAWSAYLSFSDEGYVKDDEKIDAAALLQTLKDSTEKGNEGRRQRGWAELHVIDWAVPPAYNPTTKRLEWATLAQSSNGHVANFYTKILGRRGYTTVQLVADPDQLPTAEHALDTVLGGYEFNAGETYAEWHQGDKVAEYGLAALILGGAAAVATKKGFWAVLAGFFAAAWKFVAAAVLGLGAWVRSLFKKKA